MSKRRMFVVAGDLHISPTVYKSRMLTMRGDAYYALAQIGAYCATHDVNLLLAGDVMDIERPECRCCGLGDTLLLCSIGPEGPRLRFYRPRPPCAGPVAVIASRTPGSAAAAAVRVAPVVRTSSIKTTPGGDGRRARKTGEPRTAALGPALPAHQTGRASNLTTDNPVRCESASASAAAGSIP